MDPKNNTATSISEERFLALQLPLPPSIDINAAYLKGMTRSQQRFYTYAKHDKLIEEVLGLLCKRLERCFKIITENDLDSVLDYRSEQKIWQK